MLVKTRIDFENLQTGVPITPKGTTLDLPEAEALHYIGLNLMEPSAEAPQAPQAPIPDSHVTSQPRPEKPPAAKGSGKKTYS